MLFRSRSSAASRIRFLRGPATAALSAVLVALAIGYVALPSSPSVAITVHEVSGARPFDYTVSDAGPAVVATVGTVARRARRARPVETIYGSITANVPIKNPRLIVKGVGRHVKGRKATLALRHNGAFRARVHLKPGVYRLTISLTTGGKSRSAKARVRLRNHHAYAISLTVRDHVITAFIPMTGY